MTPPVAGDEVPVERPVVLLPESLATELVGRRPTPSACEGVETLLDERVVLCVLLIKGIAHLSCSYLGCLIAPRAPRPWGGLGRPRWDQYPSRRACSSMFSSVTMLRRSVMISGVTVIKAMVWTWSPSMPMTARVPRMR